MMPQNTLTPQPSSLTLLNTTPSLPLILSLPALQVHLSSCHSSKMSRTLLSQEVGPTDYALGVPFPDRFLCIQVSVQMSAYLCDLPYLLIEIANIPFVVPSLTCFIFSSKHLVIYVFIYHTQQHINSMTKGVFVLFTGATQHADWGFAMSWH